ncbi:MAG: ABC transporter ATP-binding protein, partial [bacterium]|nr:ABC transporter ATP-binding protein [bacterium]
QEELDMAMILITHDLGVVAGRTQRIGVMYAGKMVETADTSTLFANMHHPYTEALFKSIPRVDNESHTRLDAISGRPPDMARELEGCRFAPRCRYAQNRCISEEPELLEASAPNHQQACFYPVGSAHNQQTAAANQQAGITAAGLDLTAAAVS